MACLCVCEVIFVVSVVFRHGTSWTVIRYVSRGCLVLNLFIATIQISVPGLLHFYISATTTDTVLGTTTSCRY